MDGQSFIAGVPRKHIAFVRNMRREFGIKISKPLSQDEALEIINLATQAEKKLILKTDKQDPTYTEGMTMVQEVQGVKITFNRQRATKMVMVAKQAQEALEGFFQKAGLRGEMKVSLVRQRTGSPHTQGIRLLPFNGQDVLLAVQLGGNDSLLNKGIHPPQDVDAETLHKQLKGAIEGSAAQNKSGQEHLSTQELVETDGKVIQDNRSDHETPDENKRMEFRVVQLVKHIVWGYPSQHRALRRCRRKFIGSMNIPCEDASEPNCFYARVEADRYTDFRRYVRSLHLWSAEATEGVALAVLITTQQELEKNEPELSKKKAKKGTGEVSVEAQQNGSTAPENLPAHRQRSRRPRRALERLSGCDALT
ncbi:hypothetical protein IIB49_00055, partial [Patescibacteria group bacterium]|nr:hypothetical protein [Patescibacteria group bacterium]